MCQHAKFRACCTHDWEGKNVYYNLVWKAKGKWLRERAKRIWKDNIKMDVKISVFLHILLMYNMRRLGHEAYMIWNLKIYTRIWFGKPKWLRERAKRILKDIIKMDFKSSVFFTQFTYVLACDVQGMLRT